MKKAITVFTAIIVIIAALISVGAMTACGSVNENSSSGTETTAKTETPVFDFEDEDLAKYYALASLDILTPEGIAKEKEDYVESRSAKNEGEKMQLVSGTVVKAEYKLSNADLTNVLESGSMEFTVGQDERFTGLSAALKDSMLTVGKERTVRGLRSADYPDESTVVLTVTATKITPPAVTADEYEKPLKYYRNYLLLEYNKTIPQSEMTISEGDAVITAYKLISRTDNDKYKVGDVIDSSDNLSFNVGAGKTLADFDRAFIGHKTGDKFDNEMKLPDDYGDEYKHGIEVTFECEVKKISKALTETSAQEMGYEGVDDFNASTEAVIRDRYLTSSAAMALLKKSSKLISLPADALYNYKDEQTYYQYYYLRYLVYYYSHLGVTTDIDTMAKAKFGYDSAQDYLVYYFNSDALAEEAEGAVESNLFLYSLISAAGLEVSNAEFNEKYADDVAIILGYSGKADYLGMLKTCYDVEGDRATALMKDEYYRIKAEEYLERRSLYK